MAAQVVTVREGFDASGKSASTSTPPIRTLDPGEKVVVEDINLLCTDGGRNTEYWIKVRKDR